MQLVTFNTYGSVIERLSDSMAIRIAYLFGEKLALAGDTIFQFNYKEFFEIFSFKQKLDFVEAKSKADYEEAPLDFQQIRQMYKIFNKSKNKPAHIIASMKRIQQQTDVLYKIYLEEYIKKQYINSGFATLKELVNGNPINGFETNPVNLEKSNTKFEIKGSSVLSLEFDETNNPKLFLLYEEFFYMPSIEAAKQLNINDIDASLPENIIIEPLLTIPNVSFLNAAELTVLREKLANARKTFCAIIDDWVNMCFEKNNFDERKLLITTTLKSAANKIKNQLTDDIHLKHADIVMDKSYPITIGIAEVPFQLLLNYHAECGIIKAETLQVMKVLQTKNERFNRKWPVMFYKFLQNGNTQINEEVNIVTAKKTIYID